ncbi:iron ABC transporter permease [uncultured Bartonella sp.]|uniref:FecCD family ABC transporter permease n=1 Tax=uncultured Bartonella sp. TaxID=104108 RepID=UPI00261DC9AC|nr:iron ABC transporter permease [uncultured Bartonella sp.]
MMRSTLVPASLIVIGLFAVIIVNLAVGAYPVSFYDLFRWLAWRFALSSPPDKNIIIIVENIRAPRIVAALLIGASLSCAGAAYQSLFRNPLVSPDLLAVSSGAAFGASLSILFSLSFFMLQLSAFIGGVFAVLIVLTIAYFARRRDRILALVLAGIVVSALLGSAVSLVKILADPYEQLPLLTFWLLGSLSRIQSFEIYPLAPVFVVATAAIIVMRSRIDVMSVGEEEAQTLGIHTGHIRLAVIVLATLLTSAAVSISGIIGWVGLVVPHIARMMVGPSFGRMGILSALFGGLFLIFVDTLARTLAAVEIPLGILTALIGAPIFVFLLVKGKQ